jgi:hypothetical protein
MAVALSACLSKVDVLVVKITESVSTYREKHILNVTRLQFLYNDTNSLDGIGEAFADGINDPSRV